ncbi:hypothetical protein [Phyllobacterium sophorae]|jgi:hypothetical protein|uniref:Uncharacterized protein n=1 Tax=Phyllobacterium sophorae TaxID=1520277 RepID=A0A2P7BC59_9HYPH|nr:hypothetical protein [Phyllobacterium sophorae]PSH64046.1 hypothetical protein CU103_13430 [Phyllobacterium sophorae]
MNEAKIAITAGASKCDREGRAMQFYRSSIPILAAALIASTAAVAPVHAFNIKNQTEASTESTDVSNERFQQAAVLEARAYICGTDEASEAAMRAGMKETGLPEDIAVEIVSDLASGIIDKAEETGSRALCGKAKVQLSNF